MYFYFLKHKNGMFILVNSLDSGVRLNWVQILAIFLTSSLTLAMIYKFSDPEFPLMQNGNINSSPHPWGWCEDSRK